MTPQKINAKNRKVLCPETNSSILKKVTHELTMAVKIFNKKAVGLSNVVETAFPIKKNKKPNPYASVPSIKNKKTTLIGSPYVITVLLALSKSMPILGTDITIDIVVTTIEKKVTIVLSCGMFFIFMIEANQ